MLYQIIRDKHTRLLRSCPGSGKTRAIVHKALACIDDVFGTSRRILCITYTNAAVDEIDDRVRALGTDETSEYCEISTIHSFCLNYILGPHCHLLQPFQSGLDVVSAESTWYKSIAVELIRKHRLKPFAVEQLAQVHREPDDSIFVPDGVTQEAGAEFLTRADQEGKVNLADIVYFSLVLLRNARYISRGLASRFAWILVDEFQDTSAAQVEIIKHIFDYGYSRLFLVGDPNQSIYGFAGAKPHLMDLLAEHSRAKTDIQLLGNYRCSAKIVTTAERICKADMQAVGTHRDCSIEPQYIDAPTAKDAILGAFIPALQKESIPIGRAAILAPQWFILFQLARELRSRGFPVYGPGARPYRRSLEFAQFAEHVAAYSQSRDPSTWSGALRALYFLVLNLTGESCAWLYRYEGKKILVTLLNSLVALYKDYPVAVQWLHHASATTATILQSVDLLDLASKGKLLASAKSMIEMTEQSIRKEGSDPLSYRTEALGMFAKPTECIQLMTLHSSKGREFDAVAIVDIHEDLLPHWSDKSAQGVAESARLLYVGITRAKRLLMLFTHTSSSRKAPSRFLGENYLRLR